MTQKLFLTSALAMGFVAPAFAEPSHTGEFPSTGLMQEDYTYTNAATSTNMDGVYSGTVNAVAEYDIIDYIVNAGQYLPADSETVITCPAGSFCPGISGNVQYNQSSDQGIQTCPSGFGSSAAGASSDTQCYRACDINNVGDSVTAIAHATAISGNDYYGNGTDTCEPTACENGWHVKEATNVNNPDLMELINMNGRGSGYVATNNSGSESDSKNMTASDAGISGERNAFVVNYGNKGIIKGYGRCSTRSATDPMVITDSGVTYVLQQDGTVTDLDDKTGQSDAGNCYCNLDSYTLPNGSVIALSGPWVFHYYIEDNNSCALHCASNCANKFYGSKQYGIAFRATVFGLYQPTPAMCEANVININWNDVDPEYAGQNNENTATYGEDVRTPVKAATKKGQTFRGWRFSAPEQTNLP